MSAVRELNIKPSCTRELFGFPSKLMHQLWEKVNMLLQNPLPDGKLKKKIKSRKNLYRLRIGDYRVFYTFGDRWVCLLGIRPRKEEYKNIPSYKKPCEIPAEMEFDNEDFSEEPVRNPDFNHWHMKSTDKAGTPLPYRITREWLEELKVPPGYHEVLINCKTEEELLDLTIPEDIILRVLENQLHPNLDEVIQQPDLAVLDTRDLIKYKEGDLIGFLLRLDTEQEKLTDWALKGPTLIKGGPGTGKSTIALYRIRSILGTEVRSGENCPKILFTTYTNALIKFSVQLLEQLVGDKAKHVTVATADKVARDIVLKRLKDVKIADYRKQKEVLEQLRESLFKDSLNLRSDFLLEEFNWVIEGQNIKTLEQYLKSNRAGRGLALRASVRKTIWDLYNALITKLNGEELYTFGQIRITALEMVREGIYGEKFDYVLIDEAQDLTPVSLSLLVEICKSKEGIFLAADAGQSIYSRGFSWPEVNEKLCFKGRVRRLKRNYRSTREISRAATAFLQGKKTGNEKVNADICVHSGPKPVLRGYKSKEEQWQIATFFIREMSKFLRLKTCSTAILTPRNDLGYEAAEAMTELGLPSALMKGHELRLDSTEVKVLTMHSAKGLELPIVVIIGLQDGIIPRLPDDLQEEEKDGEIMSFRRLLYVSMTRAMRGLLVLYPEDAPSIFVNDLINDYWNTK
jgi:superfamily I DNA/RNA helicase/mRNA-degrading endonuclease RelE of RelBE toxin-antitoxin system